MVASSAVSPPPAHSPKFPVNLGAGAFPEAIGIDANAAAWSALEDADEVDQVTIHNGNDQVTVNTLTSASTGATFDQSFSVTIDGADNIWVTNRGSNTITHSATPVPLSLPLSTTSPEPAS